MPKTQFINPTEVRKSQKLELGSIPVNVYDKSMKEELSRFSKDDLVRIYRDMLIIREFETMLNLIKTTGEYKGFPIPIRDRHTFPLDRRQQLWAWPTDWILMIISSDPTVPTEKFWPRDFRPFRSWMTTSSMEIMKDIL